ncbi:MAG: hypothetical protein PHO48_01200 [Candidatus Gracilibacteria bacterium]|jgi:hypothetical protein|nr:hypothetical protein [Candidatus Gracilibacteria bacterium]MDD5178806.1 hypothetical protein [Candidatus Gracilibacteria bacterium]
MFIKDIKFLVEFSSYAERHFCKDFLKHHKARKWLETKKAIVATLERSFAFQQTKLIDNIKFSQEENMGIFKLDFRIAGTNSSPKTSGNRLIFSLCNDTGKIEVLLVYGKGHCCKKQSETQWFLEHIKNNFPQYKKHC